MTSPGRTQDGRAHARGHPRGHRRSALTPYLLLAPTLIVVGAVLVYPMISTLRRSLYTWPFPEPDQLEFVGLDNYRAILGGGSEFGAALTFTGIFTISALVLEFLIAFGGALLLDRIRRGRSIVASIVIAPYLIAPIAAGLVWRLVLGHDIGIVNYFLSFVGLGPVNWLGSSGWATVSSVLTETWASAPFVMLILLAGLTAIPEEVLQAGRIDGCTERQLFRSIVVPLLLPSIAVALIFSTIFKLRVFDLIVTLTGGGPNNDTTPIGLLIQRTFFRYFDGGPASAMSVILLVLGGLISIVYVRYVYREVKY